MQTQDSAGYEEVHRQGGFNGLTERVSMLLDAPSQTEREIKLQKRKKKCQGEIYRVCFKVPPVSFTESLFLDLEERHEERLNCLIKAPTSSYIFHHKSQ